MVEMKRLSVIIPMYNVEEYVERCIRSLEDQDISHIEYEIICINDGSPDNCREVVIKMQSEFNNIILIDQENQGVSVARNNGIDIAKGKYLLMIDPDDYVKPNSLKRKLEILDLKGLEIGFTGYIIMDQALEEIYGYDPIHKDNHSRTGIDYSYKYERGNSEILDPHRSWAVFFKTSFINSNSLRYLTDVPYLEDGEFMARVVCLASRVSFINDAFYLRTTRPGSATHSNLFYSEKARLGFLKSALHLNEFKGDSERSKDQKAFMNQQITHFVLLFIISHNIKNFIGKYRRIYKSLRTGPLAKLETDCSSKAYKNIAKYYNFSLILIYLYWMSISFFRSVKIRYSRLISNVKK